MQDFLSTEPDLEKIWSAGGSQFWICPQDSLLGMQSQAPKGMVSETCASEIQSLSAPVLAGRVISVFTVILCHHAPTLR